jgi:hypothetical protein
VVEKAIGLFHLQSIQSNSNGDVSLGGASFLLVNFLMKMEMRSLRVAVAGPSRVMNHQDLNTV